MWLTLRVFEQLARFARSLAGLVADRFAPRHLLFL